MEKKITIVFHGSLPAEMRTKLSCCNGRGLDCEWQDRKTFIVLSRQGLEETAWNTRGATSNCGEKFLWDLIFGEMSSYTQTFMVEYADALVPSGKTGKEGDSLFKQGVYQFTLAIFSVVFFRYLVESKTVSIYFHPNQCHVDDSERIWHSLLSHMFRIESQIRLTRAALELIRQYDLIAPGKEVKDSKGKLFLAITQA